MPTSWSPVIESDSTQIRVGGAFAGNDVLGYHFYAADATWLVSGPSGIAKPDAATPDWRVYYQYDRWRPTMWVAADMATSFFAGPASETGVPIAGTLRAREIETGLFVPILHARTSHRALVSAIRGIDEYTLPDRNLSRNRSAARAAWATATSHTYSYSISPEGGILAGATAEAARRALGSFADATTLTADARAYVPGVAPHHVIAIRLAGGTSTGDPIIRRTFHMGGAAPNTSVMSFGRGAISLLRGFPSDAFAGSHVALLNADYRFPIVRPQRGVGTWPLFVHTVHAAAFADAGHVWTGAFRSSAIKTSVGAEISTDLIAGYYFPFTATLGAARGHDGSGSLPDRTTVYFRVGRAF